MATLPQSIPTPHWSAQALAMVAQAKVLSGNKLEQLVVRIQRHTGRSKEACWRFVIQYGLKGRVDHRRWTEEEMDTVREELVKRSVEEVAKKLNRSPKAVRSMLMRNHLSVREIRCDVFSLESLATALRVRKSEVVFWIERGWLPATVATRGEEAFLQHHAGRPDASLQTSPARSPKAWDEKSEPLRGVCPVLLCAETHGRRTTLGCAARQA